MTQFDEALHLEVFYQQFRHAHELDDTEMHRVKFLSILKRQWQDWDYQQERRKIKIVSY